MWQCCRKTLLWTGRQLRGFFSSGNTWLQCPIVLARLYRLTNSQNKCKYACLTLQVFIQETAPLKKKKKKGIGFSDDLHHYIILIQLASSLKELWFFVTLDRFYPQSMPISSEVKRAFLLPYLHVPSLWNLTHFSSTTAELIIISQRGWNKIHIFLFGWRNPLWPSAVLYAYISQESFCIFVWARFTTFSHDLRVCTPNTHKRWTTGMSRAVRLFLPWVHASYDASLDTYT